MQVSKLVFSDTELKLAQNREVILTKKSIIDCVYNQFGNLGALVFDYFKANPGGFSEELNTLPKISKGENYMGFPWVMLDYPRCFDNDRGHFALRTFFWWGHYYLVQWQVSKSYSGQLLSALEGGKIPGQIASCPVWAGYPIDPWNHQIPQIGLDKLDTTQKFNAKNSLLKVAVPVPINQFQKLQEVVLALCRFAQDGINSLTDETGP